MANQFETLRNKIIVPALIAEKDPYRIKFTETNAELLAAQRLRYRVFNQEQGKGLLSAQSDGLDRDEFDEHSVHLVVEQKGNPVPVGTYRIILGQDSVAAMYSSREYRIEGFDSYAGVSLEVGRSCVDPAYRNGTVVALLWAGLSEVMTRSGMRYLVGCVSLEDTRPVAAWALYDYFLRHDMVSDVIRAEPRDAFLLPRPPQEETEALLNDSSAIRRVFPPLLKGYLRMGAKICGVPAFDYEFGTSDYLIVVDVARLPDRYNKHFNIKVEANPE